MHDLKNRKLLCLSACLLLMWLLFSCAECAEEAPSSDLRVQCSVASGWYSEDLDITLSLETPAENAKIYYTLNGNDPTAKDQPYSEPIHLKCAKNGLAVRPLKACVCQDGKRGPIWESCYVLSPHSQNPYGLPLVSVTSDKANLYDYKKGIFVPGITHARNKKKNPNGFIPGNYSQRGDDWVRQAHVVMYGADGSVVCDQGVGIEVSGNTSAAREIKSFKLKADKQFDAAHDKLSIPFFASEAMAAHQPVLTQYKSIRLRAGSQDQLCGANLRSAVTSRVSAESSFPGCTLSQRCLVYINGSFQEIYDMQQNYSDSFLSKRFSVSGSENIEKVKSYDPGAFSSYGLFHLLTADLNDPANRRALEEKVDMDDYLLYYAIEILLNNTDWPNNSFEMWRCKEPAIAENPYADGRFRFLIFDTDLILADTGFANFFPGSLGDTFQSILNSKYRGRSTSMFYVLRSDYYRSKMVTLLSILLNTTFEKNHLCGIIDQEHDKVIAATMKYKKSDVLKTMEAQKELMKVCASRRPQQIAYALEQHFALSDTFSLEIQSVPGLCISFENLRLLDEDRYAGPHYAGVPFVLTQQASPGYVFQYWLVNGKKVYGDRLEISTEERDAENALRISAAIERDPQPCLVIDAVSAKGNEDWVRLRNAGNAPAALGEYCLTDNLKLPDKCRLPDEMLQPGECVTVYGKKCPRPSGSPVLGFGISSNEVLYLICQGQPGDSVYIPYLEAGQAYERRQGSSQWTFAASSVPAHQQALSIPFFAYLSLDRKTVEIVPADGETKLKYVKYKLPGKKDFSETPILPETDEEGNTHFYLRLSKKSLTGKYAFQAYAENEAGEEYLAGKGTRYIKPFLEDRLDVTFRTDRKMVLTLVTDKNYPRITFAVWGNSKGQNDRKEYRAKKNSDGMWQYTVDLKTHKEKGKYTVQVLSSEKLILKCNPYVY